MLSPLRQFVLSALLWLPACFCLWFLLAGLVVWPPVTLAVALAKQLLPHTLQSFELHGATLTVLTELKVVQGAGDRVGQILLTGRPLIYAWCLPLFAGLVLATPLERRQWLRQLAIGLPLLWLVVAWGVLFELLKRLAFEAGPLGAASIERAGWSLDALALGYQFGYLILPAVTPIVLWVMLNRAFLEQLVGWRGDDREPQTVAAGPSIAGADPDAPRAKETR